MNDQQIATWVGEHPVVFTVLALPVVLTFCIIVLGVCGVQFNFRRK
jgi:hypothetical protein